MIKAYGKYHILEKIAEKKDGHLVIPDMAKDEPECGYDLDNGRMTWFRKWAAQVIERQERIFFIVHDDDIIAYEEPEE